MKCEGSAQLLAHEPRVSQPRPSPAIGPSVSHTQWLVKGESRNLLPILQKVSPLKVASERGEGGKWGASSYRRSIPVIPPKNIPWRRLHWVESPWGGDPTISGLGWRARRRPTTC